MENEPCNKQVLTLCLCSVRLNRYGKHSAYPWANPFRQTSNPSKRTAHCNTGQHTALSNHSLQACISRQCILLGLISLPFLAFRKKKKSLSRLLSGDLRCLLWGMQIVRYFFDGNKMSPTSPLSNIFSSSYLQDKIERLPKRHTSDGTLPSIWFVFVISLATTLNDVSTCNRSLIKYKK